MTYLTYEQWSQKGYQVLKGERSHRRSVDGRALFSDQQVKDKSMQLKEDDEFNVYGVQDTKEFQSVWNLQEYARMFELWPHCQDVEQLAQALGKPAKDIALRLRAARLVRQTRDTVSGLGNKVANLKPGRYRVIYNFDTVRVEDTSSGGDVAGYTRAGSWTKELRDQTFTINITSTNPFTNLSTQESTIEMTNAPLFQVITITRINGQDASTLSDDYIVKLMEERQAQIKTLSEGVAKDSVAIKARIAAMNQDIKDLMKFMDDRYEASQKATVDAAK